MNRKQFLKTISAAGVLSTLRLPNTLSAAPAKESECVLIPSETAGPFPLDLTDNSAFLRSDIREDRGGLELRLRMRIVGEDNCAPMPNVRVHIWHCDADGVYSGYNTGNNPGDVNDTCFRGHQFTDENGEVQFTTILPGWYPGRICHIHFQVYVSSSYSATSQFTFPIAPKNELYGANSELYPKGADPLSFTQDGVFADGVDGQVATLVVENDGTASSFFEATVRGAGTVGVGHYERRTEQYIHVGQPYPNPSVERVRIPFALHRSARVKCSVYDIEGKKLIDLCDAEFTAGEHLVELLPSMLGTEVSRVICQFEVVTDEGVFRIPRVIIVH